MTNEEKEEMYAMHRLGDLKRAYASAHSLRSDNPSGLSKGSSAPNAQLCPDARQRTQVAVLLTSAQTSPVDYRALYESARAKLDEIHGWIVCACISTPEDMMQNAPRIEELSRPV